MTTHLFYQGGAQIKDLAQSSTGSWEPTYDTELWKDHGIINLFVEKVEHANAEGKVSIPPQMVQVLEWEIH
ncbi:MAG: hypothetical protein ABIN97_00535 [Ginsengibacter sp.]